MSAVIDYISLQTGTQHEILKFLYDYLSAFEGMSAKIKYKIPFYYNKSWICYTNPVKKDGIELAFVRANEFTTDFPELDFRGRKQVGGIIIHDLEDLTDEIEMIVTHAIEIDRDKPYGSKRVK
ncbi:MAG: hypothetical protein RJQ09_03990 [Cyclobacteriaceae bacterium]